jgi:hypothetical protein
MLQQDINHHGRSQNGSQVGSFTTALELHDIVLFLNYAYIDIDARESRIILG